MGDTANIRWFNDGRWGTTSTVKPVFGDYVVVDTSTSKSRQQGRNLALNEMLRRINN